MRNKNMKRYVNGSKRIKNLKVVNENRVEGE